MPEQVPQHQVGRAVVRVEPDFEEFKEKSDEVLREFQERLVQVAERFHEALKLNELEKALDRLADAKPIPSAFSDNVAQGDIVQKLEEVRSLVDEISKSPALIGER